MAFAEILYEVADGIATITLNRPTRLNAWTPVMEHEVRDAMSQAEADTQARHHPHRGRPRLLRRRRHAESGRLVVRRARYRGGRGKRTRSSVRRPETPRYASRFPEDLLLFPCHRQADYCCLEWPHGRSRAGSAALLRSAFCFGSGEVQHRLFAPRADR